MKKTKPWAILVVGILMFLTSGIFPALAASDYPTHYIDVIIPYAPGGATDVILRIFKDKVEKILGQPLVFQNKPGASGAIATVYAKECKPDGYTLLVTTVTTLVLSQMTSKKPAQYTLDDFTPICNISYGPLAFMVKDDGPYKTMQDFIKAAKKQKMKYSTTGPFSQAHVAMEALCRAAGLTAIHVPYSGGSARVCTAALGGHVDMAVAAAGKMVGPGRLRILALAQEKRWNIFPDVPTLKELGYPIRVELYQSIFAPKGTPKEVVDRVYGAYKKTAEGDEKIEKAVNNAGKILNILGPEELLEVYRSQAEFFKGEFQKMKAAGK